MNDPEVAFIAVTGNDSVDSQVLMMVLPMVLIFLMPKMMNAADDETKKVLVAFYTIESNIILNVCNTNMSSKKNVFNMLI